jgi:hypothetical protein
MNPAPNPPNTFAMSIPSLDYISLFDKSVKMKKGRQGQEGRIFKGSKSNPTDTDTTPSIASFPNGEDDAIADVYTAKEPKDDDESLEQACMRSGMRRVRNLTVTQRPANTCIVHVGGVDGQAALDTDNGHDEMYEVAGLESSYIGMVSLSNVEPERNVDTHTQLEYDKTDSGSNFEQKLSQ